MVNKTHILIVEDELSLAELVQDYLVASDFDTTIISNGDEALAWFTQNSTDLIILDLMLPGTSGIDICKSIRKQSDIPIIMATAKVEEIDRIIGLNIGADDYICKPYSPRELIARVQATLRRTLKSEHASKESKALELNADQLSASLNSQTVELTLIEFKLIELLSHEPGRIFSRQYILDNIYNDYRIVSDRTVDSHIKKLRKKISALDPEKQFIHSIYGAGYKFELQDT